MADQHLSSAANALEQVLCRGLGVPPPPSALRNIKLKALKEGTAQRFPDENFNQAVQYLASRAPDRTAFEDQLRKLHVRGAKGHRELVGLMHILATDDLLKVLTKGPFQAPADTLRQTQSSSLQPLSRTLDPSEPVSTAVATQPGIVQGSASTGRAGTMPVQASAGSGAAAGGIVKQGPAVRVTSTSGGLASFSQPQQPSATAGRPLSVSAQTLTVDVHAQATAAAGVSDMRSAAGTPQFNPMFNQDGGPSPLPSTAHRPPARREYTPSLSTDMAAARMLGAASAAYPAVPVTGDLFATGGGLSDAMTSVEPTEVMQGVLRGLPAWNDNRPHLTCSDLSSAASLTALLLGTPAGANDGLLGLPPGAQEVAVMNDLLYAFLGLDGTHVKATLVDVPGSDGNAQPADQPATALTLTFTLTAGLQPHASELVHRLLPICDYVAVLQRFVETRSSYRHGLVAQAMAACLRRLLSDWAVVVAQLEHQLRTGRLSLQGLQFYCQAPAASLGLLARLAGAAASQSTTGAGLLNLLLSGVAEQAGDPSGAALLRRVLHAAAAPYFRMLGRWVGEGVLEDPYGEFMVQENPAVGRDAVEADGRLSYWTQRYTLRCDARGQPDVPQCLVSLAPTILNTGKYWNVIRESGTHRTNGATSNLLRNPASAACACLAYDPHGGYAPTIHAAHAAASAGLLCVVRGEGELVAWLRALKHTYLMDQGDWVEYLADAAHEELVGPAAHVSKPRLQSLLEMALRTSSLAQEPHTDGVMIELDPRSVVELARAAGLAKPLHGPGHKPAPGSTGTGTPPSLRSTGVRRGGDTGDLAGWEVVTLQVAVAWPLSLVVPPAAIARYQLMFRHLFQLKHAERQLGTAWQRMQSARNATKTGRDGLRPAYALANRYLWVVREVVRYSSQDVVEPHSRDLEERLRRAQDVDQVIAAHNQFLSRAVDGLLLSYPRLVRPLATLTHGAVTFAARVLAAWDAAEAAHVSGGAQPRGPTAQLDITGTAVDFEAGVSELVDGLQDLYDTAMRREAHDGPTGPTEAQSLDTREEVEALLGLIQRLQPPPSVTAAATRHASSPGGALPPTSSAALYKQLAAAAAALG